MKVYTLYSGLPEEKFSLIGIHTTIEDYKLAFLLNRNLQTKFHKATKGLEFNDVKNKASFSIYNYSSFDNKDYDWFLIANSSKGEQKKTAQSLLFAAEEKTYLIPEKKKVDFFIKITGNFNTKQLEKTIAEINNIEQIITAYLIDTEKLKSRGFLIF